MRNDPLALTQFLRFLTQAQSARIITDPARINGAMDSKIYGMFIKPILFDPKRFSLNELLRKILYGIS